MRPPALLAPVLFVLFGLLASSPASAEEVVSLGGGAVVTVRHLAPGGRPGGHGFVRLEFRDPGGDGESRPVAIRIGSERVRIRKTVDLPRGRLTVVDLPVPVVTRDSPQLRFSFEGRETRAIQWLRHGDAGDFAALVVGDSVVNRREWEAYVRRAGRRGGDGIPHVLEPADLPDRWTLLSAFDLVVVDAGASGWTPAREQVVARYVAAGGSVVLENEPAERSALGRTLAAGMGRTVSAHPSGLREGRYGLGRWVAFAGPVIRDQRGFQAWMNSTLPFTRHGNAKPFSTGIPQAMWAALDIPGLGKVPVRAFFVLILVFAVVVGPLSYGFLRRRRQLSLLLVTIPVAGFLCTGTILLYGFLSEGFGIRGAIRSFTVLDQRQHEAVTVATRTLYAGLQPDALMPGADTFLSSIEHLHRIDGTARVLDLDLDAGDRVGGGLIPSRTPTTLTTAQVGRARERLRFRRRQDGAFEILAGPDLAPVEGRHGTVLLREPGGRYLLRQADGVLVPVPESSVGDALAALVKPVWRMPHLDRPPRRDPAFIYYGYVDWHNLERRYPLRTWLERRLGGGLPPGSYLALVDRAPSLDDLGLEVEWEAGRHLLLGILADEDIVE